MVGVEFDDTTVSHGFASAFAKYLYKNGLLVLTAGVHDTIRIIPPLNVSSSEISQALSIIAQAMEHHSKTASA